MDKRYFEDLEPGLVFRGDEVAVDRTEMLEFARRYDPQPMHLDDDAARALGLEAAIASGPFTFALSSASMQPIVQREIAFLPGGLGFEMSFVAPVYADDRVRLTVEVTELRTSSKPGRGFAKTTQAVVNQDDVAVLELQNTWVIATRPEPSE